jgi:hypothetical protein
MECEVGTQQGTEVWTPTAARTSMCTVSVSRASGRRAAWVRGFVRQPATAVGAGRKARPGSSRFPFTEPRLEVVTYGIKVFTLYIPGAGAPGQHPLGGNE